MSSVNYAISCQQILIHHNKETITKLIPRDVHTKKEFYCRFLMFEFSRNFRLNKT